MASLLCFPPELKSKKSIIIKKVDEVIYDRSTDEIADEVALLNSWIGDEIDTVFKFPNSLIIKEIVNQTSIAKKMHRSRIKSL